MRRRIHQRPDQFLVQQALCHGSGAQTLQIETKHKPGRGAAYQAGISDVYV